MNAQEHKALGVEGKIAVGYKPGPIRCHVCTRMLPRSPAACWVPCAHCCFWEIPPGSVGQALTVYDPRPCPSMAPDDDGVTATCAEQNRFVWECEPLWDLGEDPIDDDLVASLRSGAV